MPTFSLSLCLFLTPTYEVRMKVLFSQVSVCPHLRGGGVPHSQVRTGGGYPVPRSGWGEYPHPRSGQGVPHSQVRTSGWGVPHSHVWTGDGVTPSQIQMEWAGYPSSRSGQGVPSHPGQVPGQDRGTLGYLPVPVRPQVRTGSTLGYHCHPGQVPG